MWDTAKWQSSDSNVMYVLPVSQLNTGMQGRINIIISLNRKKYLIITIIRVEIRKIAVLLSRPVTSCLTNHSKRCMSRLCNNHVRFLFVHHRQPSFGFESSVSSTLLRSDVNAPVKIKTRRPASDDRTARAANFRQDLEAT